MPAEQASLSLRAPSTTALAAKSDAPPYPFRRAAAVLFRLAADRLDEGSPSQRDDEIARGLIAAALMQSPHMTMATAINQFVSALRFAGFDIDVAIGALDRLYTGAAMPWEPGFGVALGQLRKIEKAVDNAFDALPPGAHVDQICKLFGDIDIATNALRSTLGGDFAADADSHIGRVNVSVAVAVSVEVHS